MSLQTAFEKITSYPGPPEGFRAHLRQCDLDRPFAPLWETWDSARLIQKVILYIVQAYSRESEWVLQGADWGAVKEHVARQVDLPAELYATVVHLGNWEDYEVREKKDPQNLQQFEEAENRAEELEEEAPTSEEDLIANKVMNAINAWMDREGDRDLRHLRLLQDQYEEMMAAASQKILKSKGGVDFAAKALCRKEAQLILEEIEAWEKKIREREPRMGKEARQEIKQIKTLRPELFNQI